MKVYEIQFHKRYSLQFKYFFIFYISLNSGRGCLADLLADESIVSPYFSSPESLEDIIEGMNANSIFGLEDLDCLFINSKSKTKKQWITSLLYEDYGVEDFSQLLAHLCWNNEEVSKRVAKQILVACN